MYDFFNRAIDVPDPKIQASLSHQLGGEDWRDHLDQLMRQGLPREYAILNLFTEALKSAGNFKYVLNTPIARRTIDRSLSHLCYGTRSEKGLEVFRDIERTAIIQQIIAREGAKRSEREQREGQWELYLATEAESKTAVDRWVEQQTKDARIYLLDALIKNKKMFYKDVLIELLYRYRLRVPEIGKLVWGGYRGGLYQIEGLVKNQRRPKAENILVANQH
jgi:hypothetical protein